jgi:hypothetical protein
MCVGGRGGERALSGEYVGGVCRYVVCMCVAVFCGRWDRVGFCAVGDVEINSGYTYIP